MQTYREMLAELVKRAGSERRAAAYFGIAQSSFNAWTRGRALPDDEQARRMAELLGHDEAYVIAVVHGERAKSDEMRATWARIAEAFGRAALVAVVAGIVAPTPTNAAQSAPTSKGLCVMSTRRRRWWSVALPFLPPVIPRQSDRLAQ